MALLRLRRDLAWLFSPWSLLSVVGFAPKRSAARPRARQRPRLDAENFGGEVLCCFFPELKASRIYSSFIFSAFRVGHHFLISVFFFPASRSGVFFSVG